MTDVRALLAAERQSRRITHPNLTYSKSGALTCNICSLNIKSEQLWPGHLKSLNHRKNIQRISETATVTTRPTKRKIESVEDDDLQREHEVDSRKKPRSASQSLQEIDVAHSVAAISPIVDIDSLPAPPSEIPGESTAVAVGHESTLAQEQPDASRVDEDEWAAFERDVAVLAQPGYASATIEAAPVTTADLAEQQQQHQKSNEIQQREEEAEAEKEEESRRLEEEFDVMEEMEERVKRLRERREALRLGDSTIQLGTVDPLDEEGDNQREPQKVHDEGSDEDSDTDQIDDWYG